MRLSRHIILWLILLLLLCVAILNVWHLWRQTTNPGDTNNPESLAVYWIIKVAHGQPLYTDFRNPPYNLTNFGPLYYFLVADLVRWFHLNDAAIFIWGRRLVLSMTLAIAALIGARMKAKANHGLLTMIAVLFFLSSYALYPVAVTCRPDIQAALFSLAGLLFYRHFRGKALAYFSIVLFVAAYLSKQSYISAPLTVVIYELLQDKRRAMLFAAIYCASLAAVLLTMHLSTAGLSTLNMITANVAPPMKWLNIRIVLNQFLQTSPLSVIVGFAALAVPGAPRFERIYFLTSFALASLTSGRMGSAVNYFLEPLIAASLLCPFVLRVAIEPHQPPLLRGLLPLTFAVLLIPQFNFLLLTLQTLKFPVETEVRTIVRNANGYVLSDSPRLAFLAPQPMFMDPLSLSFIEASGVWSSHGIVDMIRLHQIQYVVLTSPIENSATWQRFHRLPETVVKQIQSDYQLWRIVDGYYVYVPAVR